MEYVTGDRFWTKTKDINRQYSYLDKNVKCDVLIVGAGISGALTAYEFSKYSKDIMVVDKNLVGYKSTSISTAILQYEIDKDFIGLKNLHNEEWATKSFKLCEEAVHGIRKIVNELEEDCEFNYRDCFYYTNKSSDIKNLKKEFDIRKEYGFDVSYIDEKDAMDKFSFPVKGGIYTKNASGEINPYKFTRALIKSVEDKGARIYENTNIVEYKYVDDGLIAVTQNGFKIECNKVVICSGYLGRTFFDKEISELSRTFTLVTEPVNQFDGWYNRCIIRDTEDPYIYFRTTQDNRILVGGEDVDIKGERSKAANLRHNKMLSQDKYNKLETILKSMFPYIEDIKIDCQFSGVFAETYDGLPYIGEHSDFKNFYFNLGYGSNGILYASLGAKMLAKLYYEKEDKNLDLFSFER